MVIGTQLGVHGNWTFSGSIGCGNLTDGAFEDRKREGNERGGQLVPPPLSSHSTEGRGELI